MPGLSFPSYHRLNNAWQPVPAWVLWPMRLLALAALALAGYLLYQHLQASADGLTPVLGCGDQGCDTVLASQWSKWFDLPIAGLGVGVYGALLLSLCLAGSWSSEYLARGAWFLAVMLTLLAATAGAWLVYVQSEYLEEFCPYCMMIHGCAMGLFVLVLLGTLLKDGQKYIGGTVLAGVLGVAGAGILAAGQMSDHSSPTFRTELTENSTGAPNAISPDPSASVAGTGENQTGKPSPTSTAVKPAVSGTKPKTPAEPDYRTHREITVRGGKVTVDVFDNMLMGPADAPHVVVALFDYTCPHCRKLHQQLSDAVQLYRGQLAVVMLPTPYNAECNQAVTVTPPQHVHACEIARLAVTVWREKRAKFAELDKWLFQLDATPSAAEATNKVANLLGVGFATLSNKTSQPEVDLHVHRGIEIYRTMAEGPKGDRVLPKLLLPAETIHGVSTFDELCQVLERNLKIKKPDAKEFNSKQP